MKNIKNSLLFLSIGRNTICEMSDNKELQYFIQNEASDYQIINILVNNKIPETKYNISEEYKVWNLFQNIIQEIIEDKELKKLFFEMGPICEYNLSSSKIISEFILEASPQQNYGQKLYNSMKTAMSNSKSMLAKGTKATVDAAASKASEGPLQTIAVGVAGGAAATIIAFAANKIYQNFLSKAAKVCKGKPEKAACMRSYKNKALTMKIAKLRSGMSTCNKAKNADACKKSLQKKIGKLQSKVDNIKK